MHPADPLPDLQALLRRAVCSGCGSRALTGRQYDIGPRHGDQTLPGGVRMGLITFETCDGRDVEVRQALAEYRARWGKDFVHPVDPEFGGVE